MLCVFKPKNTPVLLKLFFFVVMINTNVLESEADCTLMSPSSIEHTLLEKLRPLYGHMFKTKDIASNSTYNVSICEKVEGESDGVGATQNASDGKHIIGRYDQAEITGGSNWMLLKYHGGDAYKHDEHCNKSMRSTHIMIICDPDVLFGTLQIIEERTSSFITCYYMFEVGSNVSCVPKPAEMNTGRSSGTVFCILFFTAAILYLGLGFMYKRYIAGAQGLEQIPNYSFWKDFGNLQADGCDFVCRCGSRRESNAYRGIDDVLDREDERDDQLLN